MNYTFPVIRNISDVLSAIEGRDEFIVAERPGDYTVINYTVMMDDTFPPVQTINDAIRRECRGLVFRTSTGEILHRRLHKFFNANERDETTVSNVRWDKPHVILEKLDGSMVTPISTPDGRRWGTKMGITEIALQVEEFVRTRKEYDLLCSFMDYRGFTPVFEWCSRKQRIVIDYPEDQLVLIAARHTVTGEYLPYRDLMFSAKMFTVPIVKQYEGTAATMQDLINETKGLENAEGYVIRFDNGHMIKIKAELYLKLHKTKDDVSREKNVIKLVVDNKADDLKQFMLEDDRKKLNQFEHNFWQGLKATADNMQEKFEVYKSQATDKKDFATNFVQKLVAPNEQRFYYLLWDNNKAIDVLTKYVSDNCATQTKVDSCRWVFNCNWDYLSKEE